MKKLLLLILAVFSFSSGAYAIHGAKVSFLGSSTFSMKHLSLTGLLTGDYTPFEHSVGAAIMIPASDHVDVCIGANATVNLEKTVPVLCSTGFRYIFGGQNDMFRPYVKFSSGLYILTSDAMVTKASPANAAPLKPLTLMSSVAAELGFDLRVSDRIFITSGIDINMLGMKCKEENNNPRFTITAGIGFLF